MDIKYWVEFSKRKNSTKRPADADSHPITVFLKANTSMEKPTFVVDGDPMTGINYIQAMGHYYFVDDISINANNLFEIQCSQDVLATYKSEIGAYTGRVVYSSSNYDLLLPDNRMVASEDYEYKNNTYSLPYNFNTTGCYILGVIGKSASSVANVNGVASYYALSSIQLMIIMNEVISTDFLDNLVKEFTNPMDAIISCSWIPLSISQLVGTSESIYIGTMSTGLSGIKLTQRAYGFTKNGFVFTYPSIARSDKTYLRFSPFSTGILYLPFVGTVPLDLDVLGMYDSIDISSELDVFTGDIVYHIWRGNGIVSTYGGNCATKIPLAASGYSSMGIASGILTTLGGVAGAIVGGAVGSTAAAVAATNAVATGVSGAFGTARSAEIHTTINGSNSSVIGIYAGTDVTCTIITRKPVDDIEAMASEMGLPCGKTVQISTLSGYVQCENASIQLSGFNNDKNEVNSFVNGGFYYE